ncbi:carbohydrate binding domain-containing protein [Catenovulum adriaticum]|uniref:Carbohydrate binding domain-containing protein n=1 Tax=Catenovulum adriaticum TaxID=2984846 RepID=A0ABY7AQT6_9ALTE|nr:carbohydrate binding domain-containing protein [Catenovulum sp. TS8]WAJ71915.1 carbohydrate binding domain-containing protein [Catenovulum sp. TS8]
MQKLNKILLIMVTSGALSACSDEDSSSTTVLPIEEVDQEETGFVLDRDLSNNIYGRSTFEDGTTGGWEANSDSVNVTTSQDAQDGVYSLAVSGRSNINDAAGVELLNNTFQQDKYKFSAHVKLTQPTNDVNAKLVAKYTFPRTPTAADPKDFYEQIVTLTDSEVVTSEDWTELAGEHTIALASTFAEQGLTEPLSGPLSVVIYPQIDSQNADYLMDSFLISEPSWPQNGAISLEAECAIVGSTWSKLEDNSASGQQYVVVDSTGLADTSPSWLDKAAYVQFDFNVTQEQLDATQGQDYKLYYRYIAGASGTNDSIFAAYSDGTTQTGFTKLEPNRNLAWEWSEYSIPNLTPGDHTVIFHWREDGFKLDKVIISPDVPEGKERRGINCGE